MDTETLPFFDFNKYETTLKADQYALMVHGSADDADMVRSILLPAIVTASG